MQIFKVDHLHSVYMTKTNTFTIISLRKKKVSVILEVCKYIFMYMNYKAWYTKHVICVNLAKKYIIIYFCCWHNALSPNDNDFLDSL